jgi:4-amino-4-deoxy-L-arabinose transferase-like glycosyltransferase
MKGWHMYAAAALLSAGLLVSLLATAGGLGFARDEGFYDRAALGYQAWFDELFEDPAAALTRESVDRHWEYNHEHPALMKTLFGFSWRVFHRRTGWLRPSTAIRLPGMVMAALCLFVTVVWGWRLYGPMAGIAAGVLLAAQPRFFYHAHLACFDVPVAAMWLATVYAYWRAQSSRRWEVLSGVIFGLCLCTKLNAFFIPPILVIHHLALLWLERRSGDRRRPVIPMSLVWMAIIGPVIFFLHWPWVWFDSLERIGFYLGFHRDHPHYNMEYFGTTIFGPPTPISFPFVMTALTVPATTLLLGLVGLWLRGRVLVQRLRGRGGDEPTFPPSEGGAPARSLGSDLLVILCLLWPMAIIAWPTVPIFGGTKHWLPAMPFLALLAGAGLARVVAGIGALATDLKWRRVVVAAVVSLLLAPALRETASSHPFGLTHYNVLIGGVPGAADAGLNRQYWGYTTGSLLDWFNQRVGPGESVFFHDTAYDAYRMYREDGTLRRDIRWGSTEGADWAIVHHEQHMAHVEFEIWERFGVTVPVEVVTHEGVPVVSVFQMVGSGRGPRP